MLVAGMGLGKSGAILLHAGAQELHYGRWPGLFILAPLQVALNWVREVPGWRPDLRVSLIAGSKAQREAALKKDADVYIMSYDNTPWLDKYGPKNWSTFGRMMACDESTRLRGTRAHFRTSSLGNRSLRTDGGTQTNALARHAADFDMWINATGTPCPNGMQNWWPQIWYLDGGWRLGNSYTAFEQRWFMDDPYDKSGFPAKVPQPGAVEDILGRIADVVTVVRTEDYLSVAEPHIVDRVVELPDSVRKQYTDMKERMALSIDDRKIAVLSPAAKAQKLLQIAAGFAYWRDEDLDPDLKLCEELHTAKVDAVESILNETDEPLVIFYQHQATLQMLQKKFGKRLRELDKKGRAQEDWNNGKIEILACQYQRGGMGLSLQHGGRNICLIEPTFKADDYEQAIERLGPLRQMQSGYNRTVNLFRVIAHNTHDLHVYKKLAAKINLQDYAVDLLKDML